MVADGVVRTLMVNEEKPVSGFCGFGSVIWVYFGAFDTGVAWHEDSLLPVKPVSLMARGSFPKYVE